VIADDARLARTSRERRHGLIGRERLGSGEALVIPKCRQVHTFGMLFPIDVLFVDRDGFVVRICRELAPRRLSLFVPRARNAIELPAGMVEMTGTEPRDRIEIG
jgi:uncharacterized protein